MEKIMLFIFARMEEIVYVLTWLLLPIIIPSHGSLLRLQRKRHKQTETWSNSSVLEVGEEKQEPTYSVPCSGPQGPWFLGLASSPGGL